MQAIAFFYRLRRISAQPMLIFVALIQKMQNLNKKSMEQLQEYLWTESIPLVFVLAFMAAIEAMAIVVSITIRFRKVSHLLIANTFGLFLFFFLMSVAIAKTEIGCWLLAGMIIVFFLTFPIYMLSERFRNWVQPMITKNDGENRIS